MIETTKEVKIKLSKRKIILTILLVIIIVVISFMISGIKSLFKDKKISNLGNMGLAKEYDKVIYYNKWEDGIYKVKGNKETKLIDETAYSINVVDDVIYYITVSKDKEILLKSKVTNYVLTFYPYIRESFKKLDGKNGFHLQVLSEQMRSCFIKI